MESNKEYFKKIGLTPGDSYLIKLEYFDNLGSYCGTGEYFTTQPWMFDVSDEIKSMLDSKTLPNMEGTSDVNIYVNTTNHPNGFPLLLPMDNNKIVKNGDLFTDTNSNSIGDVEYTINLDYFKSSGKYYTDGYFTTKQLNANIIFKDICEMKQEHKLPNVGNGDFVIYIDASEHPDSFKKIIFNN